MNQLTFHTASDTHSNAGRTAPLIHKWFARRRPEAIRELLAGLDGSGNGRSLRILDPFAGSGMILLESLVKGHSVFGIDINPVAWLIARQTLDPPDVERVEGAFHTIDEAVGPEIRSLYGTKTPMNTPAELVTAFYVRVVETDKEADFELHHNYLIARQRAKNRATYYCPNCSRVFVSSCQDVVVCPGCKLRFEWRKGTVSRGIVSTGTEEIPLTGLYRQQSVAPRFKLIAVESYSEESGRLFHGPCQEDYTNIETARLRCLDDDIANELSVASIPTNRRDPRPISHGFKFYGQLFAPRQLLSLALIASVINDFEDQDLRYTLALALSDTAGNNNRMCRYAADWLKLTPAFGLHGFHMVTRPIEGNVWGASRGRGSFRNCVYKAIRAYNTIRQEVGDIEEENKLRLTREVMCMPAQGLSELRLGPMDAIITDPPYFDNIDYAELSDFYFQWLRIVLDRQPPFHRQFSMDDRDLATIAGLARDPVLFSNELSQILTEASNNLTPKGVIAFSYHHARSEAWECLSRALRKASIGPYRVIFVRSELENGFHSSRGNIKTDAIFYCRKMTALQDVNRDDVISNAISSLASLGNLKPIDMTNARYAIATTVFALCPTKSFEEVVNSVTEFAG